MTIGERIKAERKKRGLTQRQLGELLGVSAAAVGQYENKYSAPNSRTLKKIANAMCIPVENLIDLSSVTGCSEETTGDKIRTARKQLLITQAELSEITGIPEITIRQYEAGKYRPKHEAMMKIANALNCPVEYFYTSRSVEQQKKSTPSVAFIKECLGNETFNELREADIEAISVSLKSLVPILVDLVAKTHIVSKSLARYGEGLVLNSLVTEMRGSEG